MALKLCENNKSVKINTLLISLQNQLGLGCIKWYRHEELDPYVIAIAEYLNSRLILSGACTTLQKLQEFTEFYEDGMNLIISDKIIDLTHLMKLDTTDPEYREELFTLAWGTFMSSVYMQLMYNYAGVFDDSSVSTYDCHSGCHKSDCDSLLGTWITPPSNGTGDWTSSSVSGNCGCNN